MSSEQYHMVSVNAKITCRSYFAVAATSSVCKEDAKLCAHR